MEHLSGGPEPVSVHIAGELMVVSAAPGWTELEWTDALSPYAHLDASLVGLSDEGDGTEIFIFQLATDVAA